MKKLRSVVFIALFAGFLMCIPGANSSEVSAQGAQDFVVVNRTGVEIYAMYVSPHTTNEWEEDVLGADTLLPGESLLITFSRKERARLWDLRVEDDEGNYIEWQKLNLLKISKVTLFYRNGRATAVVE